MTTDLEEGNDFTPRFDTAGLIPAIVTNYDSGEVLMLAWMSELALKTTLETGEAHYWSRSRKELWHKGATSGNRQIVKEIRTDCDQDTILISVKQIGSKACHTGRESCFYRSVPIGSYPPGKLRFTMKKET